MYRAAVLRNIVEREVKRKKKSISSNNTDIIFVQRLNLNRDPYLWRSTCLVMILFKNSLHSCVKQTFPRRFRIIYNRRRGRRLQNIITRKAVREGFSRTKKQNATCPWVMCTVMLDTKTLARRGGVP